jgi:Na+/proline symporter
MLPVFILNYLPNGIIGIVIVAIFAAAMSSLSTTLKALADITMEDYVIKIKKLNEKQYLNYSRLTVLFWIVICVLTAAFAAGIADTVIEAINKIGSVFYGPILATFSAAILLKRINGKSINIGLISGVALNIYLWKFQPQIFWFWWNLFGLITTIVVAYLASFIFVKEPELQKEKIELDWWNKSTYYLIVFFFFIVIFSMGIYYWLQ